MKHNKLFLLVIALMLGAMVLSACGGQAQEAVQEVAPTVAAAVEEVAPTVEAAVEEAMEEPTEEPMEEPTEEPMETTSTLVIWADDQRIPVLETLVDDFAESAGVEVILEQVQIGDMLEQTRIAIPAGEGPDIWIAPHDQIGQYVESGLIAPMDLGAKADMIAPVALQAFNYNSELYALPYATENVAFFRNVDMVSEPVETWDEMLEVGSALMDEGVADNVTIFANTGYHIIGINTAYGGYIFGQDADGNYVADDVGLDSPGFIASGEWIQQAVNDGYIPATPDEATMNTLFAEGSLPFVIQGPWMLNTYREGDVNFVVEPLPSGPAGPGAPFLGAQGFVVNAQSDNLLLAQTFLTELVATDETMAAFQAQDPRIPAWIPTLEAVDDVDLAGFGAAGLSAQPMPNIPQMGSVWGSWGDAVQLIMNGEDPTESLTNGAQQIRDAIAGG